MSMKSWLPRYFQPRQLLLGGVALLTLGLLTDLQSLPSLGSRNSKTCEQIIQSKTALSRQQLAQFLTVPEGAKPAKVREVIHQPYCKLASLRVRSGMVSDREAYPLAFDPQTWLVVLYEGEQYVGYEFKVH